MYTTIIDSLRQWNRTHDRHATLQYVYFALAVILLIVAGLASLVNYRLGQSILFLSGVMLLIFIANAVMWALTESLIVTKLSKKPSKR